MGKEITFDKFIRWAGVTLIVLAVLYMTNVTARFCSFAGPERKVNF